MAEIREQDRPHLDLVWDALRKVTRHAPGNQVGAFDLFNAIGSFARERGAERPPAGAIRHLVDAAGYPYAVTRYDSGKKRDQRFLNLALKESR
jgi:hypothetical protein